MHAWRRGLACRRAAVDRRTKILCVEPAGRYYPQDVGRHDQSQMGLRTGPPATQRGTWARPLRRQILDRVTSTCPDDNDRLRLPPIPPPQSSGTEKKESRNRRRNRACRQSGKRSSTSSHAPHHDDVLTVRCPSQKPQRKICQSSAKPPSTLPKSLIPYIDKYLA